MAGYLRTESGVGAAARGYIAALQALGLDIALTDLSQLTGNRSEDPTLHGCDGSHPHDINLVCVDVEPHFAVVSHLGPDFFRGHYNIGIWAWELSRFPEKWYDRFAYYDEIWVGTSFVAGALSPISPIPIVRIPPVLAARSEGSRAAGRRRIGASPGEVVFLFVFDVHSHLERKNPLAVIEAFRSAFAPHDPARLVLKAVNAHAAPRDFAILQKRAAGYPVSILNGYWPAQDLRDLMAAADVYVSLHRAEGTGLTISDAMALGKPVIATGWSGNMDFMTVANSYPVEYTLRQIGSHVGPYPTAETWAEPSIEHAAAQMRHVFENREEAVARGAAARADIGAKFSIAAIADLVRDRLHAIGVRRNLTEFRARSWASYWDYRALATRLRDVVSAATPTDATVMVVSKGDEALLALDGRDAWHFPQTHDGIYAGAHPANSSDAIAHLELLRGRGGKFLVFPSTALWWFDYYREFRQHLDDHYRKVVDQPHTCRMYALEETPS